MSKGRPCAEIRGLALHVRRGEAPPHSLHILGALLGFGFVVGATQGSIKGIFSKKRSLGLKRSHGSTIVASISEDCPDLIGCFVFGERRPCDRRGAKGLFVFAWESNFANFFELFCGAVRLGGMGGG